LQPLCFGREPKAKVVTEKKKKILHFDMCSFLSFLSLKKLQIAIDKLVASHESEGMMLELQI